MINITDLSIIICDILFLAYGASRGFLRSLIGPIAFLLGTALAALAFNITKNILTSFLVAFFAPFILSWIMSGLLNLWYKREDWSPNPISQILGGIITFLWGMVFVLMMIAFISILPQTNEGMKLVHDDIVRSYCYNGIKPFIDTNFFPTTTISNATPAQSQTDFDTISKDPRFQAVVNDPEIQKYIQDKNYAALMSNPKVMALTQQMINDPEMLKRLMRAAQHPPAAPNQTPTKK